MIIEIELDGQRRQVTLRRDRDRWIVEIDGCTVEVTVADADGRWSMLVGPRMGLRPEGGSHEPAAAPVEATPAGPGLSRKSYEIAFERGASGELLVHVNGVAVPLTIVNEVGYRLAKAGRRGRSGRDAGAAGPRTIVAPMPGRIVKVLVKPYETVSAGQPLVVVEAMKMENELRAPRGGTVAEVRVNEGSSVEANTVLLVLR